jgi:GNAT superfamily N-acetyltransferase
MNRLAVERRYFQEHPGGVFDESWHDRPAMTYQVEDYFAVLPELRGLLPDHWEEIAQNRDAIKLEPDYETYALLAEHGALVVVTLREGGTLVGYHLSILRAHLHYKSSLTCFTDIFYLKPTHRKGMAGYKLLKFFRDTMKARGVQRIYMSMKLTHEIGPLLDRLGFKAVERIYTMVCP